MVSESVQLPSEEQLPPETSLLEPERWFAVGVIVKLVDELEEQSPPPAVGFPLGRAFGGGGGCPPFGGGGGLPPQIVTPSGYNSIEELSSPVFLSQRLPVPGIRRSAEQSPLPSLLT